MGRAVAVERDTAQTVRLTGSDKTELICQVATIGHFVNISLQYCGALRKSSEANDRKGARLQAWIGASTVKGLENPRSCASHPSCSFVL